MDEKELLMGVIDGITSQNVELATDSFRELTDIKIAKIIAQSQNPPSSDDE